MLKETIPTRNTVSISALLCLGFGLPGTSVLMMAGVEDLESVTVAAMEGILQQSQEVLGAGAGTRHLMPTARDSAVWDLICSVTLLHIY